ncbi:MAG: M56 family metallopeptidase [Acidobacteriaceae bacterium]|nr:M56 family metallopeptidase [Acidobacteriaceae bacterium]
MTGPGSLLSPDLMQTLGWTLAHFLWQGAALAVLLYIFLAFSRSAIVRYWAAVSTLVLMTAAPVLTFALLHQSAQPASSVATFERALTDLGTIASATGVVPVAATRPLITINWPACFVGAWLAGVLACGIRALGGWVLVRRLYHQQRQPIAPFLAERCLAIQHRLGITRTVSYFHSRLVQVPAVIGWFRPVVLLPLTALTGLSPEQLEAIIAHELAHIRRFDSFVNLFQIAAETGLFYHPAVWWVSRLIRTERENCCDDIAVALCGDAGCYARALTLMEGWRATPSLVLAANSGALKARISRLLGLQAVTRSVPPAGLAAIGILCVAGVLLATTNFNEVLTNISSTDPAPASGAEASAQPVPPPAFPADQTGSTPAPAVSRGFKPAPQAVPAPASDGDNQEPTPQTSTPHDSEDKSSYIEGLQQAGLKNIRVDELIALKIQGVSPDYIRQMHAAGFDPKAGELIAMKVQGITPEYVKKVRDAWPNAKLSGIIAMKVQGVNPADASEFRRVGLNDLNLGQLIAFRVQGITPEYVRELQSSGLTDLNTGEIIAARVQGITPEFIQKVRAHGFQHLSLHQLIALKIANVF